MNDRKRLELLTAYAEERGWHVDFDPTPEEECDPAQRLISINGAASARTQVYALLHELGHAEQPALTGRLFQAGAWGELEAELDAWVRGWRIAESLSLALPPRGYQQSARGALSTYAHYCAGRRA